MSRSIWQYYFVWPLVWAVPFLLWGQQDTAFTELPDRDLSFLETESNSTTDPSVLLDWRAARRELPLDLNRASEADLHELRLLSQRQISALLHYRKRMRGFHSLYELQAVPLFDLSSIRRLLPYVQLRHDRANTLRRWQHYWSAARTEMRLRWNRVLEAQRGYQPAGGAPPYAGDPQQWRYHFRYRYGTDFSFGLAVEKDRGEPWLPPRRGLFDYHSGHLYLRELSPLLRTLSIGDYSLRLGQGLIFNTAFSVGKGLGLASLLRAGRRLRPYAGLNESRFLRGAAAELQLPAGLQALVFWSGRRQSGSLQAADSSGYAPAFTALREDGYHRTAAERAGRHTVGHRIYGLSVQYARPGGQLALNMLQHRFSLPLQPRPQVYNTFYFRGRSLRNISLDYRWRWKNLHGFGEWGLSDNGALATVNGLLLGLGPRVDLAVVHRHYPRHFHALWSAPVAETSDSRNEIGTYWGLEVRPADRWSVQGYFDRWRHPWLRFGALAPSHGHEYRLRTTYRQRRHLQTYLEVSYEAKERTESSATLSPRKRLQLRYHLALQLRHSLEWRSRLDWGQLLQAGQAGQYGLVVYQDILFRPVESPWHLSTRFAIFDTDAYAIRFYSYENGLLYQFNIPAYYGRGCRYYLNVRYRPLRSLTLEARYAQTYRADTDTVGSGTEATLSPSRTEATLQLSWKF